MGSSNDINKRLQIAADESSIENNIDSPKSDSDEKIIAEPTHVKKSSQARMFSFSETHIQYLSPKGASLKFNDLIQDLINNFIQLIGKFANAGLYNDIKNKFKKIHSINEDFRQHPDDMNYLIKIKIELVSAIEKLKDMTKQDPIKRNNSSLHDLLKGRVCSEYIKTLFPANLYDKLKSKLMLEEVLAEKDEDENKEKDFSHEEKELLNKLLEESDDDEEDDPSEHKTPSPGG